MRSLKNSARRLAILGLSLFILLSGITIKSVVWNTEAKRARVNEAPTSGALETGTALSEPDQATKQRLTEAFGKLPIRFEPNQGQAPKEVKFLSYGSNHSMYLTSTEAVLAIPKDGGRTKSDTTSALNSMAENAKPRTIKLALLKMQLRGANPNAPVTGLDEQSGKTNYIQSSDSANWHTNLPGYSKVKYENVYPGVDLMFYGHEDQLEYDFRLTPGADPNQIKLDFKGADKITIDQNGTLVISVGGKKVQQHKPVIYQELNGQRKDIDGGYVIRGRHEVGFKLGAYDLSKQLVIDPTIQYSTGVAGGGGIFGITVDTNGYAYVVGQAEPPGSLISTEGPLGTQVSTTRFGAFVAKLTPSGNALVYSTLVGNGTAFYAIAIDPSGNAYITGNFSGNGGDFPVVNSWRPTYDTGALLAKLNADGTQVLYSTAIAGATSGNAIAVDNSGIAYVTGATPCTLLDVTPNAFQPNFGGNCGAPDAFLAKVNTNLSGYSSLLYLSYFGGSGGEGSGFGSNNLQPVYGIAADNAGHAYFSGFTASLDLPTKNAAQATYGGGIGDGYVACIDTNVSGNAGLIYSTYLGGSGEDSVSGIAIDGSGNAYVTGYTKSADFPLKNPVQASNAGNSDAFITKLDSTGAIVYSTYMGGVGVDVSFAIAVDSQGDAYITGETALGGPGTKYIGDAYDPNALGAYGTAGWHIFLTRLNASGNQVDYSVFMAGGNTIASPGTGASIAVDSAQCAYIGGTNGDSFYPYVNSIPDPNPYQFGFYEDRGQGPAIVTKLCGGGSVATPTPTPTPTATATPTPTPSCQTSITVPATADIGLSGMPNGSTWQFDAVPANSAVQVTGIPVTSGDQLKFLAFGRTYFIPGSDFFYQDPFFAGPDGEEGAFASNIFSNGDGTEGIVAPRGALLGVFLDDNEPDLTSPPGGYSDFSTLAPRDYLTLSPQLKQVFFIGDGQTSSGAQQSIIVPAGATRLFLATHDYFGHMALKAGGLTVEVATCGQNPTPPPAPTPTPGTCSITLTVPGTANPWLAGMPDGTSASFCPGLGGDSAPNESPVKVTGIPVTGGDQFNFSATGLVDNEGLGFTSPYGGSGQGHSHAAGAENGIADITAPGSSLIGVFLDDNQPNLSPAPAALDFSTRTYLTLSPALKQPFYIGDGTDLSGAVRTITAPPAATRLFLATMDGCGWFDNPGSFMVTVTGSCSAPTPTPTPTPTSTPTKPIAPVVTGGLPPDGGLLGPGTPGNPGHVSTVVTGTGNPGCTIQLTVSDQHEVGGNNNRTLTATVDSTGYWTIPLTLDDCDPVIDIVQICGGVASDPVHRHIFVDGTPPVFTNGGPSDGTNFTTGGGGTATIILDGSASDPNTDHCVSNCGGVSYQWILVGGGPGGTDLILGGGGSGALLNGGSGLSINLPPGDYDIEVIVTDAAGNKLIKHCHRHVRRPLTVTGGLPGDGGIYGPGDGINIGHVTRLITGTGNSGCTVQVAVTDPTHPQSVANNQTYTANVTTNGTWSLPLTLDDCDPVITVTEVCDGVSDSGDVIRQHVYVDGTPPTVGLGDGTIYVAAGPTGSMGAIVLDAAASDAGSEVPNNVLSYDWYIVPGGGTGTPTLLCGGCLGIYTINEPAGDYYFDVVVTDRAGNKTRKRCHRTVLKRPTAITYTGDTLIPNGGTATLQGVLTDITPPLGPTPVPVVGRTVTLTLGSGPSAQSCTSVSDSTGFVRCTVSPVNQPLGPTGVAIDVFAGDDVYLPSNNGAQTTIFAFATATGTFVIGDLNAKVGNQITFWGAQWYNNNSLSGGPPPTDNSFKGFEAVNNPNPPRCGGNWTTTPGNSPPPPATIPSYMGIIVSSSITKSGSVITGNIPQIVVVKTDAGYDANPGHTGTGTIVAVYCK